MKGRTGARNIPRLTCTCPSGRSDCISVGICASSVALLKVTFGHFIVQSNQEQPERTGVIRRRVSTVLLNGGAGLMVLGGVGDLLLVSPPELWSQPLGQPVGTLPPAVARLLMSLLHALGSALIASGIAVLFFINGPLRRGERWTGVAIALVAVLADGVNALQIYLFGGFYFWVPLTFVGLVLLGLALAHLPPAVFPAASKRRAQD